MEIYRNDTQARATLTGIGMHDKINSIVISKGDLETRYGLGEGPPPADYVLSNSQYWVNRTTGDVHGPEGVLENKFEFGSIPVPYRFTHFCGKFQVWWRYEVDGEHFEETAQYDVVQPLFDAQMLADFDSDFSNMTSSEVKRLERIIRAVIEASTGQKFEATRETLRARSYNGSTLALPKRLISLEVPGRVFGIPVDVESDGWIIRGRAVGFESQMRYTNPIYDTVYYNTFSHDRYALKGIYGYNTVPEQITLAAMLLAQDYGCREALWRDRYITNMKNADWRVEYHDKAFVGTGNIKVDQILQKYTLNKMVVI